MGLVEKYIHKKVSENDHQITIDNLSYVELCVLSELIDLQKEMIVTAANRPTETTE